MTAVALPLINRMSEIFLTKRLRNLMPFLNLDLKIVLRVCFSLSKLSMNAPRVRMPEFILYG